MPVVARHDDHQPRTVSTTGDAGHPTRADERFARAVDGAVPRPADDQFATELAIVHRLRGAAGSVVLPDPARTRIADTLRAHLHPTDTAAPDPTSEPRPADAAPVGRRTGQPAPVGRRIGRATARRGGRATAGGSRTGAAQSGGCRTGAARSGGSRPGGRRTWGVGRPLGVGAVLGVLGCLAVAAAMVGVLVSQGARPGDPFYDVKRGWQDVTMVLAADGQHHLRIADDRLADLGAVLARPDAVPDGRRVLDDFDAEASAAARILTGSGTNGGQQDLTALSRWATASSARIAALQPRLPAALRHRVADSRGLLAGMRDRVRALRARLDCAVITSGRQDALGAVPASGSCTPPSAGAAAMVSGALPAGAAPGR